MANASAGSGLWSIHLINRYHYRQRQSVYSRNWMLFLAYNFYTKITNVLFDVKLFGLWFTYLFFFSFLNESFFLLFLHVHSQRTSLTVSALLLSISLYSWASCFFCCFSFFFSSELLLTLSSSCAPYNKRLDVLLFVNIVMIVLYHASAEYISTKSDLMTYHFVLNDCNPKPSMIETSGHTCDYD